MRRFLRVLMVAGLVLAAVGGFAQSTGGRIIGQVTDASKAVIPNAKITLTNEETGVTQSVQSDGGGNYSFLQVPVGRFTVTAESPGFKKEVSKGVELSLNQVLTLPLTLQPGAVTEEVTVTGAAPLVDTTSTQLGTSVDAKTVTGLPLNARDTYQLLQIQPGVTSVGGSDLFAGSDTAGSVSVNGGRGRTNNFSVNGGDGNDLFLNSPAIQPSPDSIQEFRVITNTFDAEYGRNSGSVINVVTKSGTNKIHGSLYEFFRNDSLNAKGFFDPRTPDFTQNQFGGTIGGPIHKDKTFFFFSYEGRRILQGLTSDAARVPTTAERAGDFTNDPEHPGQLNTGFSGTLNDDTVAQVLLNRPGCSAAIAGTGGAAPAAGTLWSSIFNTNVIPVPCMDPVALDLLGQFVKLPNASTTGGGLDRYQAIPNGHDDSNQAALKLDHAFNQNHNVSLYYYLQDGTTDRPFSHFESFTPNVLPGFPTISATRSQQVNASYVWTLSPKAVNEFRFTYFRESQGKFLHPQRTNAVQDSCMTVNQNICFTGTTDTPTVILPDPKFGITPGLGPSREGIPFISIAGGFTIGNNFEGEIPQTGNTYQWSDNLTKIWGDHTLKFGGDFRMQHFDQTLFFNINGDYNYSAGGGNDPGLVDSAGNPNLLPNYLLGLPNLYSQGSAATSRYRTDSLYLFAQDSWKIKPNFTVNYGLRWELNTPFKDLNKRVQSFRPGQATTTYPCQLQNPVQIGLYGSSDCSPGGPAGAIFPTGLVVPGDAGVPDGFADTYYNAFAPRIGIAWSPNSTNKLVGGPGKMSIRTGFGIFYNPIEQLVLEQLGAQPPFGGSQYLVDTFFQTPFVPQSCTNPCDANSGVNPNPYNGFLTPAPGTSIDWSQFRPILLFGQVPKREHPQYTMQYNFTVQRELAKDWGLTLAYVGSQSRHLLATRDLNYGNAQTCLDLQSLFDTGNAAYTGAVNGISDTSCGNFGADNTYGFVLQPNDQLHLPNGSLVTGGAGGTPIALVGLRPYSSPNCDPLNGYNPGTQSFTNGCPADGLEVFSSIFSQETSSNAVYNSFQASLEKRFSKGFQFLAAYTLSKSEDDVSSFEQILNPICNACNRSLSLFDARNRFVFSYVWQLPIPKYSGVKKTLLNGWTVSGITTFQSGFPIRIESQDDQELQGSFDFEYPGKPDLISPFVTQDPRTHGGLYFDPTAFADATLGTLGTAKRSICCGPGIKQWDFSVQKDTKLSERVNMQMRAEFFNIFNTTQFLNPDGNFSDGADFGRIKRARDPRQMQFALKFAF